MPEDGYSVIVVGGGHAGVEAAWAAANLVARPRSIALVTLDPAKIAVMPCNPAIGGLAKGQLVREIDALGGLMGLAADSTGIMFKVLNTSKGAAVHGPRCQSDKHAYARFVQACVAGRPEIDVIQGGVASLLTEPVAGSGRRRIVGVAVRPGGPSGPGAEVHSLKAEAVVLTTGTFMRGLMHTGTDRTPGGRHGEAPASAMSRALIDLGFELGRLKTGTPPRLKRSSIAWDDLPVQGGDEAPRAFSDLSEALDGRPADQAILGVPSALTRFPTLAQVTCRQTHTTASAHELIRANLDRAPIFSGQIESAGPRYCPSIEDKVVRFSDRTQHGVFLEPESLGDDWVYCNGISTSLPKDVQERVVRAMPGCARAHIHRYGYAVEYDMVRPHQIHATGMTKLVDGLFLAGQINGTSGYEEAAAQGLVAGVNAVRHGRGLGGWVLGRDRAYIGVLMDDLVTRTPVEPYRMFTSRAEHRLMLRADNAADRLTPEAIDLGLLETTELGRLRRGLFAQRRAWVRAAAEVLERVELGGRSLGEHCRRPEFTPDELAGAASAALRGRGVPRIVWQTLHAERRYEPYVARQQAEIQRQARLERRALPEWVDYGAFASMRTEARESLARFRPATFGQAGRLEGVTPADLTLLSVLVERARRDRGAVSV